jgi:hypothetical protein
VFTIPEKGGLTESSTYCMTALIPHACKVLLNNIFYSVKGMIMDNLSHRQGRFCIDYSTVWHILILRLFVEGRLATKQEFTSLFCGFQKVFDPFWHNGLWANFKAVGMPGKVIGFFKNLYEKSEMAVRTNKGLSTRVIVALGSRQRMRYGKNTNILLQNKP